MVVNYRPVLYGNDTTFHNSDCKLENMNNFIYINKQIKSSKSWYNVNQLVLFKLIN